MEEPTQKETVMPDAADILIAHMLKELSDLKRELKEAQSQKAARHESEDSGKLYEALAKAQLEMEIAKMDSANPFFKSKYADLTSIMKASRPYLAKNGLSVIQRILPGKENTSFLYTRLGHASGQWIESRVHIEPLKKDVQSLGSYITYLRRYSYGALVGVVSSEEDDDGEVAMQDSRAGAAVKKATTITKAQLQILSEELKGEDSLVEYVLKTAQVGKLSDLPAAKYTNVLNWIRDNKNKEVE